MVKAGQGTAVVRCIDGDVEKHSYDVYRYPDAGPYLLRIG